MIILVHSAPVTLERDHGRHPNLGVLCCPRSTYGEDITTWPWAADNGAYSAWDEERYVKMLNKIKHREGCIFVTVPDVVGDSRATLNLFYEWWPVLHGRGLPIALVGQDGMLPEEVPWPVIDCLFIGGTSVWKMGDEAARLGREAKRRGCWLHMGRVNTRRRIIYAKAIGCDSIDGTNFSMYRQTNLPWALQYAGDPVQESAAGVW